MRVYLCGPINGCTDAECKDWRTYAKLNLKYTRDPMRHDYRGKEDANIHAIVENDKSDIDDCHVVLVNYTAPSVGTSMEILYAWERGKTVVTVCPEDVVVSPWLRYHSHFMFTKFSSAFAIINGMR